MTQFAAVTSLAPVGATFVDWSLHYLTGQHEYYRVGSGWQTLSNDPVTETNAHGHNKNHPNGFKQTTEFYNDFLLQSGQLFTAYPHMLDPMIASQDLDVNVNDSSNAIQLTRYRQQDYKKIFEYLTEHKIPVVYINQDDQYQLFRLQRPGHTTKNSKQELSDRLHQARSMRFRQDSFNHDTNIFIDFKFPHCWINSSELWHNGASTMIRILDFCQLKLVNERFDTWHKIYNKWQRIQLNNLDFIFRHQHIVDAIALGWYYDIGELTPIQEAVIVHLLLEKYNIEIPNSIGKLAGSTQTLHQLLNRTTS